MLCYSAYSQVDYEWRIISSNSIHIEYFGQQKRFSILEIVAMCKFVIWAVGHDRKSFESLWKAFVWVHLSHIEEELNIK